MGRRYKGKRAQGWEGARTHPSRVRGQESAQMGEYNSGRA